MGCGCQERRQRRAESMAASATGSGSYMVEYPDGTTELFPTEPLAAAARAARGGTVREV